MNMKDNMRKVMDTPRTDAMNKPRITDIGPSGRAVADLERDLARLTEENEALRKEAQATLAQLGEYSLDCQLLARWVREIAPQSVRETADKWVPDRGEGS